MPYNVPEEPFLLFIENVRLFAIVEKVLIAVQKGSVDGEKNLYKNSIDPFSAVFDTLVQGISLNRWLEQEKSRQVQKTLQNAIGTFHQEVLGSVSGWKDLGTGNIVDLINEERKIIAEVKNKHNTTKGNHRTAIYDDIKMLINEDYNGYTGYYVEIIPKNKKKYDVPFTPPDNTEKDKEKKNRPINEKIRIIDGESFYKLVTGRPKALEELYKALPKVIGIILDREVANIEGEELFEYLFRKTY